MSNSVTLLFQLLPALVGSQAITPGDTVLPAAVAPMIGGPAVDWQRVRDGTPAPFDTARTRPRTKAVELSGSYHTRLVIHRWLAFSMVPLFIGTYVTGDQILKHSNVEDAPRWARSLHGPFAAATEIVFVGSTVTGVWNFWASRKDPVGRTRRIIHSVLSLAADAGFAYTGLAIAPGRRDSQQSRKIHRNWAVASIGVSVVSGTLMLLFK